MDWINLAHNMDKWRAFVHIVMEISVPQNEGVSLTSWGTKSFARSVPYRVGHSHSESQTAGYSMELLGFGRKRQRPSFRAHPAIVGRDWQKHTQNFSYVISCYQRSEHWTCQTLLWPTGWKIPTGSWNLCRSEQQQHHRPLADNILFKYLSWWRCQLLSSYRVYNKWMNKYRALVEW